MKAFKVRDSKGTTFDVDEDKLHEAEADGFLPVVTNGQEEHRVASADLPMAMKDGYKPLSHSDIGKFESGLRGLAQGASLGFADEITGALESALTDKTYEQARNESRESYKEAQEANPLTYGASEVGGSVATAFVPGLNVAKGASLAARAGQAAALGGAAGLGMSEEESLAGMAKDTAVGAALGGGLQAAGEKIVSPLLKKAGSVTDDVLQAVKPSEDGMLNRGVAKAARLFSGVDEDAALRQIQRPQQVAAAEADDFIHQVGQRAVQEADAIGGDIGREVNKAGREFNQKYGTRVFDDALALPTKIDEFLEVTKPSAKGFSPLDDKQIEELKRLSSLLKTGNVTGEDLFKFRQYLDNVEKLAGKYDKEGTSPYVRFLKSLRHDADQIIDSFDPNLDKANKEFSQYATDKSLLRPKDATAEQMIGSLYGANKKAKQDAASRLFTGATMDQAQDIAANKAFSGAMGPAGSEYGLRRIGSVAAAAGGFVPSGGFSLAIPLMTEPKVWQKGLRGFGRIEQAIKSNPQMFGKFANVLTNAANRGNQALAATHFILSQQHPEYREMTRAIQEQDSEEEQ